MIFRVSQLIDLRKKETGEKKVRKNEIEKIGETNTNIRTKIYEKNN